MRQRHTSRTDPEAMGGRKIPVTFRLGEDVRERIIAAANRRMPDIVNLSDALQDAVWLWLYEDTQVHGPQPSPRSGGGVGSPPSKSAEADGSDEVGEIPGPGEGSPGDRAEGAAVRDPIPG